MDYISGSDRFWACYELNLDLDNLYKIYDTKKLNDKNIEIVFKPSSSVESMLTIIYGYKNDDIKYACRFHAIKPIKNKSTFIENFTLDPSTIENFKFDIPINNVPLNIFYEEIVKVIVWSLK